MPNRKFLEGLRILTYEELPSHKSLYLEGLEGAEPGRIEKARKFDSRVPPELGFFAVNQQGRILGEVRVLIAKTKTSEGMMEVGGIWDVKSSPYYLRKGVASRLMERAHLFFKEKGLEYATLGTYKSLVAYRMYLKLGYKALELDHGVRAAKLPKSRARERWDLEPYSLSMDNDIYNIYCKRVEGLLGYCVRPRDFVRSREMLSGVRSKNVFICRKEGLITAYVALYRKEPTIRVAELKALEKESYLSVLAELEKMSRPIEFTVGFDKEEEEWLEEAGYTIQRKGFGVWMVKCLGDRTFEDLLGLWGVGEGRVAPLSFYDIF